MRKLLVLPFFAALLSAQAQPELVVSVGHSGAPSHAAFAMGHLVTASKSDVALIDLATGLTTAHLPQASLVEAIEANPAGDLIAVGTCGHSIQLWDVKSRRAVRRIRLAQECAESVSFSPDGAFLATGAYGCTSSGLQVWDVRTGALAQVLAKESSIRAVVFSRDGRWLAGIDDKGTASVFEWPSGRQLRTFEGLEGAGGSRSAASASPDGNYLGWIGMHGELQVWNVRTAARIVVPQARFVVTAAEFLDDGRLAYVDDHRLVLLTLPSGPMQELPLEVPRTEWLGHVGLTLSPSWLRIRRDGRMLGGSDESRTVLWDVAASKLREVTAPALTWATSMQWSRSGVLAWVDFPSGVRAWSDRSGELLDLGSDVDSTEALSFHPDGRHLAISDSSSIHIVDLQRRGTVRTLDLSAATRTGVAFSPDGSRLVFGTSDGIAIFDGRLRRQKLLATLEEHTSADLVAFSPDGRWIAAGVGGPQPAFRVWPSTGGEATTLDTNRLTYGPQPPAFSGDSRWLATFSKGELLKVWASGSWRLERTWNLPGSGRALAFAPVGSRLAVAGDGEAAIWDAETGRKLVTLPNAGSAHATEIAWSPDGARVVTSAEDGVLRFWHASDGRLLASLYTLASSRDWLLVAADGRIDGSERALNALVAWRKDERVSLDKALSGRRRAPGLWQSLSAAGSRR